MQHFQFQTVGNIISGLGSISESAMIAIPPESSFTVSNVGVSSSDSMLFSKALIPLPNSFFFKLIVLLSR